MGATVDLMEYVASELNTKRYVIAVFIDLQKAFDTVNINFLLRKLYKMGFQGTCYNLLKTYSKGRRHYTVVNGEKSEEEKVRTGVTQGSVLGPLLYLMYVHSLECAELEAKYFKFADDTVLVYSGESEIQLEETVNRDLKLYFDWLCYNKLSLNVQKQFLWLLGIRVGHPAIPRLKLMTQILKG